MKAAIYCRLSKEDEGKIGESESIQNQKSMLIQYAMEKGFELYQIYSDEDYSGIDRNRPAFNSMLHAASELKFDVVLAKTQSRFTRDMELVEKYLHGKFMEWGIRFIAVVDHVDTNDTANKKSRQINGLINNGIWKICPPMFARCLTTSGKRDCSSALLHGMDTAKTQMQKENSSSTQKQPKW